MQGPDLEHRLLVLAERPPDVRASIVVPAHQEAGIVPGPVRIFPPGDLRALIEVRARTHADDAQLSAVAHADFVGKAAEWVPLVKPSRRPGFVFYAVVTALAKARARRAGRGGIPVSGRDGARGRAGQHA